MASTASQEIAREKIIPAWQGFRPGLWQREINVRDFIQQNYEPYEGDESL
jgi:formate C-acetyltransferase